MRTETVGKKLEQDVARANLQNEFQQSSVDPCLFVKQKNDVDVMMLIWVDDLIIGASDEVSLKQTKQMLCERFKNEGLGKTLVFWGYKFPLR